MGARMRPGAHPFSSHRNEAAFNNLCRLTHYARDEVANGRNIADQTLHLTGGPDTMFRIPFLIDEPPPATRNEVADIVKGCPTGLFNRHDLLADGVPRDP